MADSGQKVTEIDVETGVVKEREATLAEKQQHQLLLDSQLEFEAELKARVEARKSALAKLAALGLTEAEIAAL